MPLHDVCYLHCNNFAKVTVAAYWFLICAALIKVVLEKASQQESKKIYMHVCTPNIATLVTAANTLYTK